MRARLLLIIALLFPLLAACGSDSDSDSATDTTAASTTSSAAATMGGITIKDFKFSPNPLTAKAGDTITVANEDGTNHSVTADDNSFDTDRFSTGTKTIKVDKAGTIAYHCKVHDSMKGVIQVG